MHEFSDMKMPAFICTSAHLHIRTFLYVSFLISAPFKSFSQQYFQQEVNYEIHVSLNDVKHELSANEKIEYKNNSNSALTEIYFHLWPNGYKNDETAFAKELYNDGDFRFINAEAKDRGFIDSLDFYINDAKAEWQLDSVNIDICKIKLNEPLKPGEKITITTSFHVKIPSANLSRFGHLGQAYFVSQWYPKPAVYDQYGWHAFPYLDQGEYYSEFGTFDVYITLPENYVVGATGELKDEHELQWLDEKAKETESVTAFSEDMNFPRSSKQAKTLHYHQDRIHDFAWFADKRYHVLKGNVELPQSHREVTTWVMFTNNQAEWWRKAIEYVNDATLYYSKWVGDYPYKSVTAVDGTIAAGIGMEYPMITLIGQAASEFELETTIAHEVGHNWFYGMLGSNEREHPWMDEGINMFFETRYAYTKYANQPDKLRNQLPQLGRVGKVLGINKITHKHLQTLDYLTGARRNTDQAPDSPSQDFSLSNYHGDVYYKTSVCFDYLKSYLGDSLFDHCMHEYFKEWKFRHPYPEDIKKVFEETSKQKLDWFFVDLLRTTKKIDYGISSVKLISQQSLDFATSKRYLLKIKNYGNVVSPFSISGMRNGKIQSIQWNQGFEKSKELLVTCDNCDAIRIDAINEIPELNKKNNFVRTSGILKKWDPVQFRFLNAPENADKTLIYFTPTIGWNNYDKLMGGLALYNVSFVPKSRTCGIEYVLNPMYSSNTKEFTGTGSASYSWHPDSHFIQSYNLASQFSSFHFDNYFYQDINGSNASSYLRYSKLSNSFNIFIRKQPTNYAKEFISLSSTLINSNDPEFVQAGNDSTYRFQTTVAKRIYNGISLTLEKNKAINPYFLRTSFSINTGFARADMEGKYLITYGKKDKGFEVRAFAGWVASSRVIENSSAPVDYRLRMSGWDGREDYEYSEVFLGRSEMDGLLSHQFVIQDGGFKVPTASGISGTWLAALNLKTSLPGILPVRLFADLGFYDYKDYPIEYRALPMFDYGAEIDIVKDIFVVYLPTGWSSDIDYYYSQNPDVFGKYSSKIRFELNLSKLNPIELIRHIEL